MRILYIANTRMPTEKAHGLQIAKTIEAFQLRGLRVETLLPRRRNYLKDSIEHYYGLRTKLEIHYIQNYFGWLESYFHRLYFSLQRLSFGLAAFVYALRSRADVIYSRELTICLFLSLAGKPAVFEDHEPKKRLRRLYNIFVKKIKRKVVVARNLADYYKKIGVDENSYIIAPNGVDVSAFENTAADKTIWQREFNLETDEKIILYVGHFYHWKGVYTLLDAAKDINGTVVLIGGIPQDRQKVEDYIRENQLTKVRVHEFVPHGEIIKFIKSADVVVLPNTAQEERSAKYTTPIKLFEYLASGVPVVASDVESFRGYLRDGENSLLCEPDNADYLASKINTVLSNEALAEDISVRAQREAGRYDWQKRAEKIVSFIQR